jgi:hypothetical protein
MVESSRPVHQPTALSVLRKARRRLEKGWCKGSYAVDQNGLQVPSTSRRAVKWCMLGAIDYDPYSNQAALKHLAECSPMSWLIATYNDAPRRTKRQVLAVVDCAIKKAGGK